MLLKVIAVENVWSATIGINFTTNSDCSGCHDLTILCLNLSNIAIITAKGVDYIVLLITLANLKQFIHWSIMIMGIYKMHVKEINIENSLQLLFWQFNQSKKIRN